MSALQPGVIPSLPEVVAQLQIVYAELGDADRDVRRAREAEVRAIEEYRMAKVRAMFDADCPRPKRGENGVTVADRDAWVDRRCATEREKARGCEAVRDAAQDHLRTMRDKASIVQTIAGLVKTELTMLGSGGAP